MSSLLHPIQSASQKCRPKHQVLVLKCYPKYQKNVQEIKPNGSELSYLLYYASTRRSKLQKVGAFLEKKTATDVWRQRLGNVQVTLQILTSIIDKTPRDITLYAGSVLTILDTVLRSKDINMVEETLPVWEAYCKNVDLPALIADQTRSKQYLNLVQLYTAFATDQQGASNRNNQSVPLSLRWRTVALRAIRAVVGSDAIAVDASAQLNAVMPVILQNLVLRDGRVLHALQEKAQTDEKKSAEVARRRRLSTATISTIDTTDANPAAASETTADADKVAEDEVRVLAVRCLKQIFSTSTSTNRGQTRLATALTLKFIAMWQKPATPPEKPNSTAFERTWAATLFESIARWTPAQDRFVIVLTAVETLVRSPIVEAVLDKQLVLARMIDHLLRSDINLIGLSVMDVLLGVVQHMLLLLQLGGRDSTLIPQQQTRDVFGIYVEAKEVFSPNIEQTAQLQRMQTKEEMTPSPTRLELLSVLQDCISDLGTHIYYTDQITDMLTAILARLKPSINSDVPSTTAAINDPVAATKAIADSASLQEDPNTDGFFSFTTARTIALRAVKDILITANSRKTSTGASAEVRSRVGVQVWEGTQWLLKDEEQDVRFAYVDALLMWLRLETSKSDLLLPKDGPRKSKPSKKDGVQNGEVTLAKRAVSNASKREQKPNKSTFYQLLHLAIYDNALDFAENDTEIPLLHLLLSVMVERLGVNVIRTGLPMIITLQNTVLQADGNRTAKAKINVTSLVHGYLLAIVEKFDLDTTKPGSEIVSQISRRKQYAIWFDKIRYPPLPIDHIKKLTGVPEKSSERQDGAVDTMKPFLDVVAFVDEIGDGYDKWLLTPPSSPPTSPGRTFSVPTLGFGYGYGTTPAQRPSPEDQMPQKVKDEMCGTWSREYCIAALEKENTGSITGSRSGAGSGLRNHLSVNPGSTTVSGRESPATSPDAPAAVTNNLGNGLGSLSKNRYSGWSGSAIQLTTSSSRDSTVRVSDLKRALTGKVENSMRRPLTASRKSFRESDADSESMVSWNETDDIDGLGDATPRPGTAISISKKDRTYHDQATVAASGQNHSLGADIPPVPKIPSTLNLPGTWPRDVSPSRPSGQAIDVENGQGQNPVTSFTSVSNRPKSSRISRPASRAGPGSVYSQNHPKSAPAKTDLIGFLAGIEAGEPGKAPETLKIDSGRKRIFTPPY